VVYDQKASSIVPEEVVRDGGTPIMERSGHAFIKRALQESGAVFAGEVSGHFFFGELGYDDALYATLAMIQILEDAGPGVQSSSLIDALPHYPITPDIRVASSPESTASILAELEDAFAGDPDSSLTKLDGLRIDWGDGWALVRPSVTEPLVTMRLEARTDTRLMEIQRTVAAASPALRRVWTP
jgi:phosphomannomutase/phosphoglucomutase